MANPNRTVATARNRKTVMVREEPFVFESGARAAAEIARKNGETVRVTSYKVGPKTNPVTKYRVRWYEAA